MCSSAMRGSKEVGFVTKRFKKVKNFESLALLSDIEREIIEHDSGDVFTLSDIERGKEDIFELDDDSIGFAEA